MTTVVVSPGVKVARFTRTKVTGLFEIYSIPLAVQLTPPASRPTQVAASFEPSKLNVQAPGAVPETTDCRLYVDGIGPRCPIKAI